MNVARRVGTLVRSRSIATVAERPLGSYQRASGLIVGRASRGFAGRDVRRCSNQRVVNPGSEYVRLMNDGKLPEHGRGMFAAY